MGGVQRGGGRWKASRSCTFQRVLPIFAVGNSRAYNGRDAGQPIIFRNAPEALAVMIADCAIRRVEGQSCVDVPNQNIRSLTDMPSARSACAWRADHARSRQSPSTYRVWRTHLRRRGQLDPGHRHHSATVPSCARHSGGRQRYSCFTASRTASSLISRPSPGPCGKGT